MSNKPPIDYTLQIHEQDELGNFFIDSPEVLGFMLYGPDLMKLLADVPEAVYKLRKMNSAPSASESRA